MSIDDRSVPARPHRRPGEATRSVSGARSKYMLPLLALGTVVAVFGVSQTGASLGMLFYLVLLACPLMHLFMHRGRHSGASGDHKGGGENEG
ncbi:hypothetical protein KBTX_02824 [wastewater metagenome]|uniref:DUF2933 domain-containing protein n=2 Tax=unclassified sequences TaxID=12908 RepID=A0A5B8RHS1_9ZZZZ|nr:MULTISPECIES: DUF2933 domain-containing protein [Arhodomonas]MCS4505351.1 DUF2933 domain-containing protein [Arhodomonas aquaeolei]QEA06485.1 hypothetical protein KBTEX_02824 [uncultured organism]